MEKVEPTKGELIFIGMGMDYTPRFEGDISNYRIRANFKNKKGRTFFVELIKWNDEFTFSFDSVEDKSGWGCAYNTSTIKHKPITSPFSKQNIINIINSEFGCCYKKLVVKDIALINRDSLISFC